LQPPKSQVEKELTSRQLCLPNEPKANTKTLAYRLGKRWKYNNWTRSNMEAFEPNRNAILRVWIGTCVLQPPRITLWVETFKWCNGNNDGTSIARTSYSLYKWPYAIHDPSFQACDQEWRKSFFCYFPTSMTLSSCSSSLSLHNVTIRWRIVLLLRANWLHWKQTSPKRTRNSLSMRRYSLPCNLTVFVAFAHSQWLIDCDANQRRMREADYAVQAEGGTVCRERCDLFRFYF
jgi:hypothetical protein